MDRPDLALPFLHSEFLRAPSLSTASRYFNRAMELWTSDQIGDETALTVNREVVAWCKRNNYDLERLGIVDRDARPASVDAQFDKVFA